MNDNAPKDKPIPQTTELSPLRVLLSKIFIAVLCASAIGYLIYDANETNKRYYAEKFTADQLARENCDFKDAEKTNIADVENEIHLP